MSSCWLTLEGLLLWVEVKDCLSFQRVELAGCLGNQGVRKCTQSLSLSLSPFLSMLVLSMGPIPDNLNMDINGMVCGLKLFCIPPRLLLMCQPIRVGFVSLAAKHTMKESFD